MYALKGVVIAIVASLTVAILFAYLFRVPIPFAGYLGPFGEFSSYNEGGFNTLSTVFLAWVFYGVLGGFAVVPILGAGAGIFAARLKSGNKNRKKALIVFSIFAGAVPVLILSVLDYIIGPW